MRISHTARVLVLVVAALAQAYGPKCADAHEALGPVLWIPAGASVTPQGTEPVAIRDGRYLYVDGSASVSFTLTSDRQRALNLVVDHFTRLGWRPRATQYMNPHLPTSFDSGWRHRCSCVQQLDPEGKPMPRRELFEWYGEWQNDRGDMAAYVMSVEGDRVSAYGSVVPAAMVRETLRRLL